MYLRRIAVTLLLIGALLLNGCDMSSLSQQRSAVPATTAAVGATSVSPAEMSSATTRAEAATAEPTMVSLPAGPILTDTLQVERIAINASGELDPTVITATARLTIELELLNRSEAEALLIFDLAPVGSLGIHLPAAAPFSDTVTITSTATPAISTATSAPTSAVSTSTPEPTAPLILVPTSVATSVPTVTLSVPVTRTPTATSAPATPTLTDTPIATPSITTTEQLSATTIWLRYDTIGTYAVRCASAMPGSAPGCSGSVEIRIVAPGSIPPATPTPIETTPTATAALTSTTTLTETATLTATGVLTETAVTVATGTAERAATDTPAPASTVVVTATTAP